ncbi:bifunctional diguanylate cyclase/phosphodiesterase [Geomonas anaerohicana]|uniref:EAL domain-containing protein n=1 Tax=Geomonas anaerohicana TaxID=2798583 RepID=A0ABS0YJG6_9BACT|nr:EAL domain-containing protein [Geomonas anaerohicana]MBJ6752440.1 EAL domain-containing protein [Geomonas anaerohicana]
MTLYRQLIIFTVVLFLLLFTGTWYAKLANTRTFLTNQLESHVQDTATSLALSISPHVAQKDLTLVEGMINALFDRGYYQKIIFSDPRGKVLIERTLPVRVEDVPQWFVALVPLKTPEAASDVMAGWNQGGTILVKSHPGYAYATLWSEVLSMTAWFAACAAFLLLAAAVGLRILLKPLAAVERQADALCRKEYQLQETLPRTREFKSVVEAMNRMTVKVKEMFEEQAATAEGLQERAYQDPVTLLGNRRLFESQVNADLARQEQNGCGVLLLLRIHGLEALNQKKGLQAGDDLVKRVAAMLKSAVNAYADTALSRLTGGDFGIFLPDVSPSEGGIIATEIAAQLGRIAMEKIALTDNIGHLGVATYQGGTSLTRLLAEADLALSAALQNGANSWEARVVTGETETLPQGQQHWKDALVRALEERRIRLDAQGVIENGPGRRLVQLELFARVMQENGEALDAALFMPVAERLKLVSSIDRMVIEEALKVDYRRLGVERVAINLSPTSLEDDAFRNWLYAFLKALPAGAPRVNFEFSEFAAVQHLQSIREFGAAVRACGHGIGLDHYGRSFSKLGYLQSLHPEYVKIDRAYTGELSGGENDSRFYVASLCSVAHSIDIKVVAEGVESEAQAAVLRELNLDAMQGYFFGRPQPLSSYPAVR